MYQQGMSVTQIASSMGLTTAAVDSYLSITTVAASGGGAPSGGASHAAVPSKAAAPSESAAPSKAPAEASKSDTKPTSTT
jgi:hypothetical protein